MGEVGLLSVVSYLLSAAKNHTHNLPTTDNR